MDKEAVGYRVIRLRDLRDEEQDHLLDRVQTPLDKRHLKILAKVAIDERKAFFARNEDARNIYESRYLASALCQGGALHYLGRGPGLKDLDIHFFYEQHPTRRQVARAVRSFAIQMPGLVLRKVDIIHTVIPSFCMGPSRGDFPATVKRFLQDTPTTNAAHLAEKAVIGLDPDTLLGVTMWLQRAFNA